MNRRAPPPPVLLRCVGCGETLGTDDLPVSAHARAHVAACEKHPLGGRLVKLIQLAKACLEEPCCSRRLRDLAEAALNGK